MTGRAARRMGGRRQTVAHAFDRAAPDAADVPGGAGQASGRIGPGAPAQPASAWPFRFAEDTRLELTPATPRPWAHVMANPSGFGTVVSNEGEIHSFRGNERQNAITPFRLESGAAQNPGQLVYVVDLADRRGRHGRLRALPPRTMPITRWSIASAPPGSATGAATSTSS